MPRHGDKKKCCRGPEGPIGPTGPTGQTEPPCCREFPEGNLFVGSNAGPTGNTGSYNVSIGPFTLNNITSGAQNTATGWGTLQDNTTGSANTANGFQALANNISGDNNNAFGLQALGKNISGNNNTGVGHQALRENTTGLSNTGCGFRSLFLNTTGNTNTGVGNFTLLSNMTGNGNVAVGNFAGRNIILNNNVCIDNQGLGTDQNITRIGTGKSKCFIDGIEGVTPDTSPVYNVIIDSLGQLGVGSSPYTPSNSANWNGNPTTVAEALDRLAAACTLLGQQP